MADHVAGGLPFGADKAGELTRFGMTNEQTAATGRDDWFKAHYAEITKRGWAASVWNDGGGHLIFDYHSLAWRSGSPFSMRHPRWRLLCGHQLEQDEKEVCVCACVCAYTTAFQA